MDGARAFDRGGALRLGSVLTTTSAPLRTSPVKRGDWILRRILGTPTPPPPADAGTLPADDKTFGGLTLRERLAQHKRRRAVRLVPPAHRPAGLPARGLRRGGPHAARPTPTASRSTSRVSSRTRRPSSGPTGCLTYLQSQETKVMTTLSRKMLGYALGRNPQASDRRLIGEMVEASSDASFSDLATRIVTSRQFRNRAQRRPRAAPTAAGAVVEGQAVHEHEPSPLPTPSRRHFLRGMGVALTLPWMESLPAFAQTAAGAPKATAPPLPPRHRLLLERRRAGALVGQGQRRRHGARTGPSPDAAASGRHGLHQGPLQPVGPRLDEPPPRPHEPAVGGARQPRSRTRSASARRWTRCWPRPLGDQTDVPSLVLGIEPNELRLEDGLSMIYGSSLSWISPTRAAAKEIYPARAFDRLVGDGSGRALDRSILDAVREESQSLRPRISKDDDHKLGEYFEGIRDIEKRIERASKEERLEGWRPTLAAARHAAPEARAAAGRAGPHEADARPDRARVPDGQDARGDADAQQRPVADELQVRRGRAGRPASRPDAQREGRRQGGDVPEDQPVPRRAVRLPDLAHEGHLGRRDDAARQLDPDVRVEPVRRRPPRRRAAADPADRQGRRLPEDRPHPRLPGPGRRSSARPAASTCR